MTTRFTTIGVEISDANDEETEAAEVAAKESGERKEEEGEEEDEESDASEQATLAEHILEQIDETYYGRLQTALLYAGSKIARGEPVHHHFIIATACKMAASLFMVLLQLVALASIMDEQVLLAGSTDDKFSTKHDDAPHNFAYIYVYELFDCAVPILALVLFSAVMVAFSVLKELRSIMFGYIVLTNAADSVIFHTNPALTTGRRALATFCWGLAHTVHLLRFGLLVQFIVSSSFLIGNSDGPSQILLNSVAALFVLDADKLLAECFSTPWKQRTAEAKGERQEMSAFLEGHAQSISARCIGERWASTLSFVNFIYLITVAAALLWQSMLLQQETSSGSNVISHALGEIQYMAWFLLTPFIAGDCLVVFVCLRQENWALFKMICFALAYEIFAAVFLVHYCLITQGISYGTMQWNPSVTVDAEGF